ncbi:hypothetical protein B7R54_00965 [Subtercola boreus]|uniref:HTH cro/C1-type domain-containing protein n=1 Tax=Subtercola boreus TaxID=120213 RepID=A0A3E0VEZ2_9MICO|nr:hypothetical protein B7R54_00965 [Subtercola boreus]TQL55198.1 DNA-binding XRE family transcriptional regulator [Subtercola boreus]
MPVETDRPEPDFEALRLKLSRLRHDAHLTYEALSELSGVSRRTLIEIEVGDSRGSLETWYHLANALNIDLGDLVRELIHRR